MAAITVCWSEREEKFQALPGQIVAGALRNVGVWSDLPCGGMGTCGGCRIEARGDLEPPTTHEIQTLTAEALNAGWRLACQAKIAGEVRVFLPELSIHSVGSQWASKTEIPAGPLGLAVDLGSTTLVGRIVNLKTGSALAEKSVINPQVGIGSDLITRIQSALEPGGKELLRSLALQGLDRLIQDLTGALNVPKSEIKRMTVAGNSVMEHIFLGLSVEGLSHFPFDPVTLESAERTAGDLGVDLNPATQVYIFPLIGSFVGGDAAAGVLATELASTEGIQLLADLGTNGEVVLAAHGVIRATSTAAGPAFEGGEIIWGMRAENGAIVDLDISGGWRLSTIGGGKPRGIAGSGLIRIVEELLAHGLLGTEGRLKRPVELTKEQKQWAIGRIRQGQFGSEVILDSEREIVLTQRDIRQLQLAKGAIRSAIDSLLEVAEITAAEIDRFALAGAFGSAINPRSLVQIGLIPDVPIERIKTVGNASLDGASKVLINEANRGEVEKLARIIRHIPLETRPSYPDAFMKALSFPVDQE